VGASVLAKKLNDNAGVQLNPGVIAFGATSGAFQPELGTKKSPLGRRA